MYEVERKLRGDHASVRPRLEHIEADFRATVEQRDTYFDHPDRSFASTDEALRVRRQRVVDGTFDVRDHVTYKGPRLDRAAKTRIERETAIDDADTLTELFRELGFTPAGIVAKTREYYETDRCAICLDAVEGIGEFVEIEARGDVTSIEDAEEVTSHIVERLGLSNAETISESYLELVLEDKGSA